MIIPSYHTYKSTSQSVLYNVLLKDGAKKFSVHAFGYLFKIILACLPFIKTAPKPTLNRNSYHIVHIQKGSQSCNKF